MAIAIITGSGTHSLPGFEQDETEALDTPYGPTSVTRGPKISGARRARSH